MKRTDERFERVVASIRNQTVDLQSEEIIAQRVWKRISDPASPSDLASLPARLESCDDYQALIGAYLADRLSEARRLLFEDHSRSCVPCRRALREARLGRAATSASLPAADDGAVGGRWLWLAAAVAVTAIASWAWLGGYLQPPRDQMVQIDAVAGEVQTPTNENRSVLAVGDWVSEGEVVRTLAGSSAILRLADGSLIEVGERSRLAVHERRHHTTVRVAQGNVIVQAAKQRQGTLDVVTEDVRASVRGTVFTVSSGAKGSRVGVLEGEVEVASGRRERLLLPGDQFTSNVRLAAVPFEAMVGWSPNSAQYLALMTEMRGLRQELATVRLARDLRYSTRLLDRVPAATVFYASLPNPGDSIEEVRSIFEERLAASDELRTWWENTFESSGISAESGAILDLLQGVSGELGAEVVVAATLDGGSAEQVVVLTELLAPASFEENLRAYLEQLDGSDSNFELRFIVDPSVDAVQGDGLLFWIADDLLVVSPSIAGIRSVAATIDSGSAFRDTSFYAQLAAVYEQGTELMGGVDIASAMPELRRSASGEDAAVLAFSGIEDLQHLVVGNRTIDEVSHTSAELGFSQPRHGIAAWLAAPAPMASLAFVSVDASFAASLVVKDPLDIIDELFDFLQTLDPQALESIAELEAQLGLDLRGDLAAALGTETAFALDGPVLPSPSWKWVIEVRDARRLQQSIERLAAKSAELVEGREGGASLELSTIEGGDRTYYVLTASAMGDVEDGSAMTEHEVYYTYEDGYLLVAGSRMVLDQALAVERSQYALLQSPQVRELMPVDGFINFSGIVWQDFGSLVESLADMTSELTATLSEEQREALATLRSDSVGPSLVSLYGEGASIRLVLTNEGTLLGGALSRGLGFGQLFGLGGLLQAERVAAAP